MIHLLGGACWKLSIIFFVDAILETKIKFGNRISIMYFKIPQCCNVGMHLSLLIVCRQLMNVGIMIKQYTKVDENVAIKEEVVKLLAINR